MHPQVEKSPALVAAHGIRHGFFGRQGGVSDGDFASLNASRSVGDDPANVVENLHRAVMALKGGPIEIALATQVHGTDVAVIDEAFSHTRRPQADAMVTSRQGIALGILTADCVPVLLADAEAGIIGAAHAGWKGSVGDIVAKTVDTMVVLGARRSRIVAAVGPAISAANYEIGGDMAQTIRTQWPNAAEFIVTEAFAHPHFDVPGLVIRQLEEVGLAAIERVGSCTYSSPELYFSHRHATHNDTRTGRQIALIARG